MSPVASAWAKDVGADLAKTNVNGAPSQSATRWEPAVRAS